MGRIFETRKATMFARWDKMSKAFARIGKEVTIAVKKAGPDPATWPTVYTIGHYTASSSPGVTVIENANAADTITVTILQGTAAIKFVRLHVTVTP